MSLAEPTCPCAGGRPGGLPPERVAELEACLASAVAELEAWFDDRARELAARAGRGALTAGEVVALIDELEERFLRVLATPDLAALRAWVEDELAREREVWSRAPSGPVPAAARATSGYVLAAGGGPSSRPPIRRAKAGTSTGFDAFVHRMGTFFGDLWSVSDDLVVDLCVRSDPQATATESVRLWLYPKRYIGGGANDTTDVLMQRLTRGKYCLLITSPELDKPEDRQREMGGGECIKPRGDLDEANYQWAHEEVDLVRYVDRYYTCNLHQDAAPGCAHEEVETGFRCKREKK